MIILYVNLLDCICPDNKRRIKEKEEILEGLSHPVNESCLDNGLLFNDMGLLI